MTTAAVALTTGFAQATPGAGLADPGFLGGAAAALLLPSDIGADIPANGDGESQTRVVVAWSYQIPISERGFDWQSPHRVVVGADLLFRGGTGGRGRLGYRFSTDNVFFGAGVSASSMGATWSPELGFKFPDSYPSSLHVLVRGEIEPRFQGVSAVTLLFGWNLL